MEALATLKDDWDGLGVDAPEAGVVAAAFELAKYLQANQIIGVRIGGIGVIGVHISGRLFVDSGLNWEVSVVQGVTGRL